jgi:hypothetical protein
MVLKIHYLMLQHNNLYQCIYVYAHVKVTIYFVLQNVLCGYYVCSFISAGMGKFIRFLEKDDDDASKEVK